ncbi:threonine/serine dehydratase [Roseiterribacter gracilis]|uniref:Serine/threonine dehydratase n=1 Tax=Roseiterribacter gracilis TaxID=2812848 RepID=A0A8S8XK36_9PROT|nr:serine/threonine dehydratase [Rhodospirillales bacterium TMPK1]
MAALFDRILAAHAAIRPDVPVTPLVRSASLSALFGCELWFKQEHLQPTGSFKIRGATNKIRTLNAVARRDGVITASTGNHGQALACAGAAAGVNVTVFVSSAAAKTKTDAIRARGATLVQIDGPPIEAELQARKHAAEIGKLYVSPYNDEDIMAGQGTLGVELAEQAPDLDAVFIATGGGGLIGGTGTALKQLSPKTRIVGVWPANSACLLRALEAGAIIDVAEQDTLSDGTAGAIEPGSVTFPVCQRVIDETVTVSEAEIAAAMRHIADAEHWIVEGAAGVALAGLIERADAYRGKKVAVVLCGRNIALDRFLQAVSA